MYFRGFVDEFSYIMVVVRVRVVALPGAVGQRAVVAVGVSGREQAAGAVEQRQGVGQLVVQVVAALGQQRAAVAVAAVHAAVDAARAGQRGVLQHVAVHLSRLVQVAGGVVLCSRGRRRRRREARMKVGTGLMQSI